jgi:hypothetical protein
MVLMQQVTYELRVRGTLSSLAVSVFEEMDLRSDTLLSGVIQDQAALHGLLERIRDLGLELIEVHQVPDAPPGSGPPTASPP